jgi:sortase A
MVIGALALAYGAAVYFWHDPVTDLFARWKQRGLAAQLADLESAYQSRVPVTTTSPGSTDGAADGATRDEDAARRIAALARSFSEQLVIGTPAGRLIVPKLDIDPVFVHGTRWGPDLSRGPGHYPETALPGLGRPVAIAGHRTTFGAWFRNIDELQTGDEIRVEMPYGTFTYRVTGHEIVANDDWSIIKPRGFEFLVLSACHPLFSAEQRWIVYARLARVNALGGLRYEVDAAAPARA